MMKYRILVKSSGGYLPPQTGYLKAEGKEAVFSSKEEAGKRADEYRRFMNSPYSSSTYSAFVEEG